MYSLNSFLDHVISFRLPLMHGLQAETAFVVFLDKS